MSTSLTKTSRYLALILRHKPEIAGITLDGHGWAHVDELLAALGASHGLTRDQLEQIVATDGKQRYAFNDDHTLIRANQGHSIPVDVELEEREPPDTLFHGTAERFAASIEREGLLPMGRLYVHLSSDIATARTVGTRHGKPLVYAVDSRSMCADGHRFWLSENRVWLTEQVPPRYLHRVEATPAKVASERAAAQAKPSAPLRIRHHFAGAVQSRGFRYACVKASGKAHVTGWVENQPDGTVICETQGDPRQQETFIRRLSALMPGRDSTWTDGQHELPLVDGERSFDVRG